MRTIFVFCAALTLAFCAGANPVSGVVFHDLNTNGTREDGEPGIAGVAVSNGADVVVTAEGGNYTLEITDPGIVFVVKPTGWSPPPDPVTNTLKFYYMHRPNGSPKLKFGGFSPTGPLPRTLDFPLQPRQETGPVRMLVLGDPQTRNFQEVQYLLRDIIAEVTGMEVDFGLTLGDNAFDNLRVFDELVQGIGRAGLPWHYVPGNHDTDYDAPSREYSYETYQRHVGPSYYAAAYGNAHILVLNDICYDLPSSDYHAELGERQLAFIRNYLAGVSSEAFIVLMMHIPIMSIKDKAALFEIIAPFKNCISLSAHTHSHGHFFLDADDGWPGEAPHHHIVQGTACGSWYGGFYNAVGIPESVMDDGTPKGYSILTIDGAAYDLAYRASGRPPTYQMDIHAPDRLASDAAETDKQVTVNFWNGTERCRLEMRLNNGDWLPMEQVEGKAPYYAELAKRQKTFIKLVSNGRAMEELSKKKLGDIRRKFKPAIGGGSPVEPSDTNHLWRATLPEGLVPGCNRVEVRAQDMFGHTHEGRCYVYYR